MKYAEEQRIRFIDFLLAQYGHLDRSALINFFGISPASATRDLRKYKDLAPGNIMFNDSEKTYYKTNSFEALYE